MYRILLLDDHSSIREGLTQIIRDNLSWNLDFCEASNGREGIEKILSSPPDLIITDIKMDEIDGIQFLQVLSDNNVECPVLVLSGYNEYSLVRNALKTGAHDYLLKPVNTAKLLEAVLHLHEKYPHFDGDLSKLAHYYAALDDPSQHSIKEQKTYFFDTPEPSEPKSKEKIKALLSDSLSAAINVESTTTINALTAYFQNLSHKSFQESEIRKDLNDWLYTLMQKNPIYLGVINKYRFTPNDLNSLIKNLPTLSQLQKAFCDTVTIYLDNCEKEISKNNDYIVKKAIEYIEKNYNQALSITDLSATLYLHPNYLSSVFSNRMGTNFRNYLREVRIKKAEELLKQNSLTIEEIAVQVGYKDVPNFCRAFKQVTAMTPTNYRKISRK